MSDLLEKEKVYLENERGGDDDNDRSDRSEGEESQSESDDAEAIASLTSLKESFNKSPRNHVVIVKTEICS